MDDCFLVNPLYWLNADEVLTLKIEKANKASFFSSVALAVNRVKLFIILELTVHFKAQKT